MSSDFYMGYGSCFYSANICSNSISLFSIVKKNNNLYNEQSLFKGTWNKLRKYRYYSNYKLKTNAVSSG